jgi:hypothetical protein
MELGGLLVRFCVDGGDEARLPVVIAGAYCAEF